MFQDNFNLTKFCLNNNGDICPLVLPSEITGGTGLMNPSIFNHNGRLYVNIRHINYTLYHSELKRFHHQWGPLQYLHPENDMTLTTKNFLCELDENFGIKKYNIVDTSNLDSSPKWHFIGLEDARLFSWDNKFYLCGVRRDTTNNGEGRMELSQIAITDHSVVEVSRDRIPILDGNFSYCEKNWMPINDQPYRWIKWTNPIDIVEFDPNRKVTTSVVKSSHKIDEIKNDLRGGSQVIRYGEYYLCITHEVFLYNSELGRKDGRYRHRFVIFDTSWNIVAYSNYFTFMDAEIEFCCGAAFYGDDLLISYSFQDNGAYILKMPSTLIDKVLVYDSRKTVQFPEALAVYINDSSEIKFGPKNYTITKEKYSTVNFDKKYECVVVPELLIDNTKYKDVAENYYIVTAETSDFYKKVLNFIQDNKQFSLSSFHESSNVVVFERNSK